MLIESSRDILFLTISFCVLSLTVFSIWFIYYLVLIMKQIFHIIKDVRQSVKKVEESIKNFKEKIDHSATSLALIGEGVKKIMEIIKDRAEDKGKKKKK